MPTLTRDGAVFVLHLGQDENRFHPDWIAEVGAHLDEVEAADGPRALVFTATGRFFSAGLDLGWLGEHLTEIDAYVASAHELLARVLAFPAPTVSALNGHTYGAGAMLGFASDHRVMRADRGYLCLPEADMGIAFTPGLTALLQAKLTPAQATATMIGAQRFGGVDARAAGLVDQAAAEADVLPTAIAHAATHAAKDGGTLATIKQRLYAPALAALTDHAANALTPA